MPIKEKHAEEEIDEEPEESPLEEEGELKADDARVKVEEDTWEDEEEIDDSG